MDTRVVGISLALLASSACADRGETRDSAAGDQGAYVTEDAAGAEQQARIERAEAAYVDELERAYVPVLDGMERKLEALDAAVQVERPAAREQVLSKTRDLRRQVGDARNKLQSLERSRVNRAELQGEIDGIIRDVNRSLDQQVASLSQTQKQLYTLALEKGPAALETAEVEVGSPGGDRDFTQRINEARARVGALEEAAETQSDEVRADIARVTKELRESASKTYNTVLRLGDLQGNDRDVALKQVRQDLAEMERRLEDAEQRIEEKDAQPQGVEQPQGMEQPMDAEPKQEKPMMREEDSELP